MSNIEYLSVGDVAANFGWTPRFVERLAVLGAIPAREANGQWHFLRDELVEWLDRKIQTLDNGHLTDLESTLEAELRSASRNVHLADRLSAGVLALDSEATAKPAVLKQLVTLAENSGLVIDGPAILTSLAEREAILSTAMPGGFAICHPRRPLPQAVRRTVFSALRTRRPVDFASEHGEKTQLFFFVTAIDDRSHLYALARIIRVLQGQTIEALFDAASPEEFLDAIRLRETELDAGQRHAE